ncbi:MAG: helix-turn-helix domain-containing protein [Erysipelotrichaceae bacterium]|nr:helix-turn-helix domain-containing protein [Erysipelotrichaceae bacterium]MBQ7890460.1 helix-turn-helix domain-containing protein [Erysipelotrichaceae bacterium]
MLNTQEIGKKIAELRKKHNMTQMELADEMEVSYQAVSNWERGNSMPDIAKLPDLAQIFHISIDELLGCSKESEIVQSLIEDENTVISVDELCEVAPLLRPSKTEMLIDHSLSESIHSKSAIKIAPFVSEDYLDEVLMQCEDIDVSDLVRLAPFLKKDTLTRIMHQNHCEKLKVKEVISLAPFLEQKVLDEWVFRTDFTHHLGGLSAIAPFVSKEVLVELFQRCKEDLHVKECCALAPFLPKGILNQMVMEHQGELMELCGLLPFIDKEYLNLLAKRCVNEKNYRFLSMIAPFL